MTIEEKRNAIEKYCHNRELCTPCSNADDICPLYGRPTSCWEDNSDGVIESNYELIFGKETSEPTNDIINHPSHYCRDGGMESIDEMVLVFGKEAVMHFCLCNVWKYRYRSSSKNGEEDLKKSDWYMRKYKELSNE